MDNEINQIEPETPAGRIETVNIDRQMRSSYIDYSMSVIVSRALPDVRDGMKPVHRRVLFGMTGLGLNYSGQTKKSARIVGEVLGKYHPQDGAVVEHEISSRFRPGKLRFHGRRLACSHALH